MEGGVHDALRVLVIILFHRHGLQQYEIVVKIHFRIHNTSVFTFTIPQYNSFQKSLNISRLSLTYIVTFLLGCATYMC